MHHPELTYRFIPGPDMEPVRRVLAELGEPEPHILLSCAWVAENPEGKIVGLSVMQSLPLIEPMNMLDTRYSGGEVIGKLFGMTRNFILESGVPRVLMHPEHRAMEIMLQRNGARGLGKLYDWRK